MGFAEELDGVLPPDLPNRAALIHGAARHLERIVEANEQMNLTRIVSPREAAIKHVLDSILPWKLFAKAKTVLDAGTGAGFPGIPLALMLPGTRFVLCESIQKKARFVEAVVAELSLANVAVTSLRAEEYLKLDRVEIVTARALVPLGKALALFAPGIRNGARALLYKGPDADSEIADALPEARKRRMTLRVVERYELPEGMGSRSIVEVSN